MLLVANVKRLYVDVAVVSTVHYEGVTALESWISQRDARAGLSKQIRTPECVCVCAG